MSKNEVQKMKIMHPNPIEFEDKLIEVEYHGETINGIPHGMGQIKRY